MTHQGRIQAAPRTTIPSNLFFTLCKMFKVAVGPRGRLPTRHALRVQSARPKAQVPVLSVSLDPALCTPHRAVCVIPRSVLRVTFPALTPSTTRRRQGDAVTCLRETRRSPGRHHCENSRLFCAQTARETRRKSNSNFHVVISMTERTRLGGRGPPQESKTSRAIESPRLESEFQV